MTGVQTCALPISVANEHVVEGALGYFINPLVLVVVGTVFLGEQLRPLQWFAVGLAVVAVVVTTFGYGRLPWVALVLAFSFAGYGVIKKIADVDPIASLTVETAYVTPFCIAYLLWLASRNSLVFGHSSLRETLLLAGAGVVTAVPLLLFSGAAIRIPLSTMGLLQYLTPSIQFFLGIFLLREPMSPVLLTGFLIVWAALAVFTFDSLRHGQRTRMQRQAHSIADDVEARHLDRSARTGMNVQRIFARNQVGLAAVAALAVAFGSGGQVHPDAREAAFTAAGQAQWQIGRAHV